MINGVTISAQAGSRLAAHIDEFSKDVVAAVLRSMGRDQVTGSIASSIFANTFLDQLALEVECGDREGLDAWASAVSDPETALEHARLVVLACACLSATYTAQHGLDEEITSYLAVRGNELAKPLEAARSIFRRAPQGDPSKLVSRDEVVASLLAAIEARDPATCDHSRAVGAWSRRIAKVMGMSVEQQDFADLCGTLHDVGKISTPLEILLKAGPLTEEEWTVMRAHARIGAKMIERIPCLKEIAPIVRAHHERMDGKGYPDRLSGTQIPLISRIIAVADSFHAMISKRPYRDPMPIPRAIDILIEGSGTQWDSTVVDAMLTILRPAQRETELRVVAGGRS
jgi:putative nucleotidyltransferase with HDIG domain